MSRLLDTLFMRRIIRRPTTNRLRKRTFFVGRLYVFAGLLSNANEFGQTRDYGRTTEKIEKQKNLKLYPTNVSSPSPLKCARTFRERKNARKNLGLLKNIKKNKRVVAVGFRNQRNYVFLAET